MSASESLRANLESIGFVQLLLLFAALIAYGVALGEAFPGVVRSIAAATGVLAAAGFSATAPGWADGVVLLALAVAMVGAFGGATWVLARLLGVDAPRRPASAGVELAATSRKASPVEPLLAPAGARASAP